jgi:TPR repeat protein
MSNVEELLTVFMYISGNGVPMDKEKAMFYFDKAADAGNTMAGFMVGYAYYIGKLREKNYVKAAPMIKKAADMGFDEAQLIMAEIYANGYGFPQNYGNAVRYLRNAVDQGSTVAMMHLADILSSGNMYNKDIASAHILYNLAAVRGVSGAAEKRALLEKTMKINDVLRAQADAESYVEKPSEVTKYVRQTYGDNVRSFVY